MEALRTACSMMGAFAFALTFVPYPIRSKVELWMRVLWDKLFSKADPFTYVEVPCKSGAGTKSKLLSVDGRHVFNSSNPFYEQVALYVGSLDIEFDTRRVSVFGVDAEQQHNPKHDTENFVFGLPLNETLSDTFQGARLTWTHTSNSKASDRMSAQAGSVDDNTTVFTLRMLKSDKRRILRPYLRHISTTAYKIRRQNTFRTLYTNNHSRGRWDPVTFKHPSTFDTIALDGDLAERIQADLRAFSESRDYYHSVGRPWKRGYLLYGPPGTGKSSLIAAIANFMQYDVYDVELTSVYSNSQLKNLLMQTKRKAVIVIEDIDCSMSTQASDRAPNSISSFGDESLDPDYMTYALPSLTKNPPNSQKTGLTLSGLLNFADGLLSCFGEERIIIFTTNHKEKLDAALLRCGRMDMHILLSYCTFSVFKKLAFNYLGIKNHDLYEELEEAMGQGVKITPASVAEILIGARKDPDMAIRKTLEAVKAGELERSSNAKTECEHSKAGTDEEGDEGHAMALERCEESKAEHD